MSSRNLLLDPAWQGCDLGHPLPDALHAVSVALPRWRDVIAYEENEPACRNALQTIYPRFGLHPLLTELTQTTAQKQFAVWPYSTEAAANAARHHCLRRAPHASAQLSMLGELVTLQTDAAATPHAKEFWQHTGLGASSRQAAIALGYSEAPSAAAADLARKKVRERLAAIHAISAERIGLYPSGMAGLHAALMAIQRLRPDKPTLQLGFPYVDVLKQPKVVFQGSELLQTEDLNVVDDALARLDPAALIVELPSNPLLRCVDLSAVANLAHSRGIPVIADDTIGTGINLNALHHADLVFTSLTKSFAGRGDVMAGSLLVSPHSPWSDQFLALVSPLAELGDPDAIALEDASRDVCERVPKLDANCLALAKRLEKHPAVADVMHPKDCPHFRSLMRSDAGHGCLLSFVLNHGETTAHKMYDALRVSKGPSLGTNFTLVCPYPLLAHYKELDWAASCGVPTHLLRVSVGLEPIEELWQRFEQALNT